MAHLKANLCIFTSDYLFLADILTEVYGVSLLFQSANISDASGGGRSFEV